MWKKWSNNRELSPISPLSTGNRVLFAAIVILAAVNSEALAIPNISIETYQDWTNEIGASGHITTIPSWDAGGFENLYPGESSAFTIPTLTALSDDQGTPALQLDFGTGAENTVFIGGITYTYDEDPSLLGGWASFSIRKRGTNDTEKYWKYSLHLLDKNGKRANWVNDIPVQQGASDPWVNVTINFANTPTTYVDGGFDITKVTLISWDYKGSPSSTTRDFTGKIDHINVVPEPATICLLGLGGLMLRKRRA